MKQLWDQLRPSERRWVIIIGCIVFLVLNYFMVWPKFKQWKVNSKHIADARATIQKCQPEIAKEATYQKALATYESSGTKIPEADQVLNFQTFYQGRAVENGIQIQSDAIRPPRTNDFSVDQQTTLEVVGGEKNLVGFLYSLGSSASQMRVREMSLHAVEPNRYQLHASLTIVASYSYQKKPAGAAKPAAKPVVTQPAPAAPPANYYKSTTVYPLGSSNQPATPAAPAARGRTNAISSTNKPAMQKH